MVSKAPSGKKTDWKNCRTCGTPIKQTDPVQEYSYCIDCNRSYLSKMERQERKQRKETQVEEYEPEELVKEVN